MDSSVSFFCLRQGPVSAIEAYRGPSACIIPLSRLSRSQLSLIIFFIIFRSLSKTRCKIPCRPPAPAFFPFVAETTLPPASGLLIQTEIFFPWPMAYKGFLTDAISREIQITPFSPLSLFCRARPLPSFIQRVRHFYQCRVTPRPPNEPQSFLNVLRTFLLRIHALKYF